MCGGLAVVYCTAKSKIQIPARVEIWIEISVPRPPLIRLLDQKWLDTRASPNPGEGEANGCRKTADTSVVKHKRNPIQSGDYWVCDNTELQIG